MPLYTHFAFQQDKILRPPPVSNYQPKIQMKTNNNSFLLCVKKGVID